MASNFAIKKNVAWESRMPVDEIEATKSPEFKKVQQLSTGCAHLQWNQHFENRALCERLGNRLGRRCAPFWCIFRFNRLENQFVEPCGTFSYNFDYIDGTGRERSALSH